MDSAAPLEGQFGGRPARAPRQGATEGRTVYVGNLSWNTAWQELKDHMRRVGEVNFVDILTGPGGRSKGCAIVEYATAEQAQAAIATLNDTELDGRLVFVREDREGSGHTGGGFGGESHEGGGGFGGSRGRFPRRGGRGGFNSAAAASSGGAAAAGSGVSGRRVYIGNLPWSVTWQRLKDHFKQAGEVAYSEVLTGPDGRSKGCGVVEFVDQAGAANAIQTLNDSQLDGRVIFVREDREERS